MSAVELRTLCAEARALAHAKQAAIDALRDCCQAELALGKRVAIAANAVAKAANTHPDAFARAQHVASIQACLTGHDAAFLHALREALTGHRVGALLAIQGNNEMSVVDAVERGIRAVETRIKETI